MKQFAFVHRKFKVYSKAIKNLYKRKTAHSRVVFLLKIALPLIAGIFIFAVIINQEFAQINRFKIDIPKLESSDKISFTMDNGSFYGQGGDDTIFSLNLYKFQENRVDNQMLFSKIRGKIFLKNANWIEFDADDGIYKKLDNNMQFMGNIFIVDNDGNRANTDVVDVDLNTMEIVGIRPIIAKMYFGDVEGEGFKFKLNERYVFTGKVKAKININKFK